MVLCKKGINPSAYTYKLKSFKMRKLTTIFFLFLAITASAQFGMPQQTEGFQWDASWISVPDAPETDAGLYLFRKTIDLNAKPASFEVYVSGDNRFKLYVNEKLVTIGPALGDLENWNYEVLDLAPYLKAGENIIAAEVWNEGSMLPVSQFSLKTGFILQGTDDATKIINTDDTWKCVEDESYSPIRQSVRGYYAAGAGDSINMSLKVKGWKVLSFNDNSWKPAQVPVQTGRFGMMGGGGASGGRTLQESIIPLRELSYLRLNTTRRTEGVDVPKNFPAEQEAFEIPANTIATILMDQDYYVNAYPTLIFSGGKDAKIKVVYAEALYDDETGAKDNRDEIEGKSILGREDIIMSDGSANQNFTALNWRTYRYVELQIETKGSPLTIDDFYGTFTGYPFEMNADIEVGDKKMDEEIADIMEVGWRTARSCAVETYMDCPYYERLQYIGDARIQLIVSYYNSGDDRLAKNALNLMDQSRQRDGVTTSRYPDTMGQLIPTYSLLYITMLHDYLMYGKDKDFLSDKVLGWRQIMNYFLSFVEDGSMKNVPGWLFTDWADGWSRNAPMSEDGSSSVLDLHLLFALQAAIELEENYGDHHFAEMYQGLADDLSQHIKDKYWVPSKNLFADTPEKDTYSQHANSMAILAGLATDEQARKIGENMLSDDSLVQATIYFKYYLHLALNEAGLGDGYLSYLDDWRRNIELGMTTYGETSDIETTRSDCHAWGASPNIEFFRIMMGIDSASPFFETVKIQPNLGDIEEVNAEMPHPKGKIAVSYEKKGNSLEADITLPQGVTGTFVWDGQTYNLKGGSNQLEIN